MTNRRTAAKAAKQRDRYLLPLPFVEWEVVLHALDPVRKATRGWARSLREKGGLSPGVTVPRRGPSGFQGKNTYNSALWLWADRFRLAGYSVDAEALQQSAQELEDRFSGGLSTFLSLHELKDLPEAPFFGELAALTADALIKRSSFKHIVLAAGQLDYLDHEFGQVMGRDLDGLPSVVDLPAQLFMARGMHKGACVWVVSRMFGDAALVEVDQAIPLPLSGHMTARFEWAKVTVPNSLDEFGSQFTDVSDDLVMAARYEATAGRMPELSHWDELFKRAEAGQLPVRHLHPAG